MDSLPKAATGGRWLTVEQAATRLGVTPRVVYGMLSRGQIGRDEKGDIKRTGERRGYRIPAVEVEDILAERAGTPAAPARAAGWPAQARLIREEMAELDAIALRLRAVTERIRAHEAALDAEKGDAR